MTPLNLSHLATFRLVVARGSFSAAADALGLTQPAVSLHVRQLEQFVRTRLVERSGRGVAATAAGLALLAHTENISQAVEDALHAVHEVSQEVSGQLRIGTGATACIHLLPPILHALREKWPLLQPGVTTGNTVDIVRAVEENRLDIGLVTLPVNSRQLVVSHCRNEEFVLICRSGEPIPACTPESLRALPFVAFEVGSGTRALVEHWFASGGVNLSPVMESGSIEAIKRLVSAGLGVSIVPKMAVEDAREREGLEVCSLSPGLYRQLGLVMRPDKIQSRGMAELIRRLS
ncbi:LysR family transcriptional regulator [Enterobacteriaceae bacterium C34A]